MEQLTTNIITFTLGVVGTIVGWLLSKYISARGEYHNKREERLRNLFLKNTSDSKSEAYNEILINILKWLVVGNIMFGVSGMTYFLEVMELYSFSYIVAGLASVTAIVFYLFAILWINKYIKYAMKQTAS